MSRSYREPYWVDGYGNPSKKITKRKANKAVKHAKNVANGGAYKKVSDSYDICDYKFKDDKKNFKVSSK